VIEERKKSNRHRHVIAMHCHRLNSLTMDVNEWNLMCAVNDAAIRISDAIIEDM
jgi:hypothetical protein